MTEEIKDPEGLLKAYEKAKSDLVALRAQVKELEAEREQFSEEVVEKWKGIALQAQALKALQDQGVKDAERILKRLDLSSVTVDEDGNLNGLEEQVSEFKADFPDLFDPKKRAGRASADIHAGGPVEKELSPSEQQAAALFG